MTHLKPGKTANASEFANPSQGTVAGLAIGHHVFAGDMTSERVAKTRKFNHEHLSSIPEGGHRARDAAIELLGLLKPRVDELAAGKPSMVAVLDPYQPALGITIRADAYRLYAEYTNPAPAGTLNARVKLKHSEHGPHGKPTYSGETEIVLEFTTKKEVVWITPMGRLSNRQMVEYLLKGFIDFCRQRMQSRI